jgi:Amt family ammonium transporter
LRQVDGSAAFGLTNPGGAIAGNGRQVWVQIVGALFVIGWNMAVTPLILFFIKYVLRIPLRMSEDMLLVGDDAVHGEAAYAIESVFSSVERNGNGNGVETAHTTAGFEGSSGGERSGEEMRNKEARRMGVAEVGETV